VVRECVALVRDQIGPVADFKRAVVVDRLPKTRSGKILRGTMVKIADGTDWKMPATIDDPTILDEITQALQSLGLAGAQALDRTRNLRQSLHYAKIPSTPRHLTAWAATEDHAGSAARAAPRGRPA
jgi:hypothetical protein